MSLCAFLRGVFFRTEEVVNKRRNHITFHEGYMTIKVEKSKSDQLRQGDEVVIAQSGGSICPVFFLREYLGRLNINPSSNEFIFRQLVKTKKSYKGSPTDNTLVIRVREAANRILGVERSRLGLRFSKLSSITPICPTLFSSEMSLCAFLRGVF